jgi:hypothetical protein
LNLGIDGDAEVFPDKVFGVRSPAILDSLLDFFWTIEGAVMDIEVKVPIVSDSLLLEVGIHGVQDLTTRRGGRSDGAFYQERHRQQDGLHTIFKRFARHVSNLFEVDRHGSLSSKSLDGPKVKPTHDDSVMPDEPGRALAFNPSGGSFCPNDIEYLRNDIDGLVFLRPDNTNGIVQGVRLGAILASHKNIQGRLPVATATFHHPDTDFGWEVPKNGIDLELAFVHLVPKVAGRPGAEYLFDDFGFFFWSHLRRE